MLRALALSTILFAIGPQAPAPASVVLHIKVVLIDADGTTIPIPRHALLISVNPTSAPPRRVVTGIDGTVDVRLRPGSYTVESDRPAVLQGRTYQWTQTVDVVAGKDAALDLAAGNAEVGAAAGNAAADAPEADPSAIIAQWQPSVVELWSPTSHASGFLVDAKGLIATNQRSVGTATSVEVQVTKTVKIMASVLAADVVRDVAVLRVDPAALAGMRPLPLPCASPGAPVAKGQELFAMGMPLGRDTRIESGTISRAEGHAIVSDLVMASGGAGGPVFNTEGAVIGLTTVAGDRDDGARPASPVVPVADACAVIATVAGKIDAAPPSAAHLPVEPARPFPVDALKDAAQRRGGSLSPYRLSSSDFDVAFITPVLTFGAQYQADQARRRNRGGSVPDAEPASMRPLMDFGNWSEYVADFPPVLLVRVTPRLVEGFWTTVGRAAARTQGVALPPIKHFKSGFARMRAFCGEVEVAPIHPFTIEQRLSESEAIHEGLYVFDPGALGPQCGAVKLLLYSEKEPQKGDSRVVDPKVLEQIWDDFAPYRR